MEGLKVYGLLSTVEKYPSEWKSVFVKDCMPAITPTTLLDEFEAVYSDSQLIRQKEGDVFYQFCTVVNSLDMNELKALLQWATGVCHQYHHLACRGKLRSLFLAVVIQDAGVDQHHQHAT